MQWKERPPLVEEKDAFRQEEFLEDPSPYIQLGRPLDNSGAGLRREYTHISFNLPFLVTKHDWKM
jgi:hypothetical protein